MSNQGLSNQGLNGLMRVSRRGSAAKGCLIAALVVFMLLLIGAGVGTYLVMKNGRSWLASGSEKVMVAMVDESSLPDSEKDEVKQVISQFKSDFVGKLVTFEDFGKIVEELTESPLFPAMIASESYANYYASNEDLSDDEKAEAELELSRVARGVFEETLSQRDLVGVLEPIEAPAGSSNRGVKISTGNIQIELKQPEDCTAEELRQVTLDARVAADEAGVSNEKFTIDPSDEIQRVIDSVMGRVSTGGDVLNTPNLTPPGEDDAEEAAEAATDAADDASDDADDGP